MHVKESEKDSLDALALADFGDPGRPSVRRPPSVQPWPLQPLPKPAQSLQSDILLTDLFSAAGCTTLLWSVSNTRSARVPFGHGL